MVQGQAAINCGIRDYDNKTQTHRQIDGQGKNNMSALARGNIIILESCEKVIHTFESVREERLGSLSPFFLKNVIILTI